MTNREHNPVVFPRMFGGIAIFAILMVLCFAFSSCTSEKKSGRQVVKIQSRYPWVIASACGSYYPTKDSVSINTIYKPGQTVEKKVHDTLRIDCEQAVKDAAKNGTKANDIKLPCPPCDSLRVDTLEHYKSVTQQSTALLKEQQHKYDLQTKELNAANEKIAGQETTIKWWMWIAIAFGGYSIVRWVVRVWAIKLP